MVKYLRIIENDAETAFWKEEDIASGTDWLKRWRTFVNDAANKVAQLKAVPAK